MLAWCRRRSSPHWRAGVASMAFRLRLKKRFEIDSCTIEYLSGEVLREVLVDDAVAGREEREDRRNE